MADIGTAYIRIAPNMTGIQGKIAAGMKGAGAQATKNLESEVNANSGGFQSAMSKLGAIAKTGGIAIAAGIGASSVGVTKLTTSMLNARAELEQQLGGSEAVFGQYSADIQKIAQSSYKNMGLSQNEFLAGANKMGSLYQGAGVSVQESMKMSAEAIQRATDVASIMGIDTSFALESVAGMAKGNFTMMDNLGVAMNDTALNAYALEKGIGKTTQQMSMQEKVSLATQMFLEKTAKYAGNYAKENETLAGSINTTKKAFQDFLSGGGDIQNFIDSLIGTIGIATPEIVKILPQIVNGIEQLVVQIIPVIANALPKLLPVIVSAATSLMGALVKNLPQIIKILVAALPQFINAIIQIAVGTLQALPQIITILAAAIPQIVDSLVDGLTSEKSLTAIIFAAVELLIAITKAIPTIINALPLVIPTIVYNIAKILTKPEFIAMMVESAVRLIGALVGGLLSMVGNVVVASFKIISKILEILSPQSLVNIGHNLIVGLWNGISNAFGWLISKIQNLCNKVIDKVREFFGVHSPSVVFAYIGKMNAVGLAEGMVRNASIVIKAADNIATEAIDTLQTFGGSLSSSFNGTIQQSRAVYSGGYTAAAPIVMNITNNVPDSITSKQVASDIAYAISQS